MDRVLADGVSPGGRHQLETTPVAILEGFQEREARGPGQATKSVLF